MTKAASLLFAWALGGCFAPVREAGRMGDRDEGPAFTLTLPPVLPPLVVIRPGISVFPGLDEEVFFSDGSYWARKDTQWYRAPDPKGAWSRVDATSVLPALVETPPGRYRRWHGEVQEGDEREEGRRYGLEESGD